MTIRIPGAAHPRAVRRRGFLWAVMLFLGACARGEPIEMASIDKVSPGVVEQGDVLRIFGQGFVEGPARVTFSGGFDPAGLRPPERRVVAMEGLAVSSTAVEVAISGAAMKALADEPLRFDGRVSVDFPTALAEKSLRIGATSCELSLDIRPAGSGVASASKRARQADRVLSLLGVALAPASSVREPLVGSVVKGGLADKVGIAPGDRVLAVDGIPLSSTSDLAGLSLSEFHEFEVVTPSGRSQKVRVRLRPSEPGASDEAVAIVLTAFAIGIFLAFASPISPKGRNGSTVDISPLAMILKGGAIFLVFTTYSAAVVAVDSRAMVTALLFGGAVGGFALSALFGAARAWERSAFFIGKVLALAAILAISLSLGSPLDVVGAVAGQGESLFGWTVWRDPFALAAGFCAIALLAPTSGVEAQPVKSLASLGDFAGKTFASMAVAAYGLGGWLVPWESHDVLGGGGDMTVAGVFFFVIKAATVFLALGALSSRGFSGRRRHEKPSRKPFIAAGALVVFLAASLLWAWACPKEELSQAGRVLSAGLFFAASAALWVRFAVGLSYDRAGARTAKARADAPSVGGDVAADSAQIM